MTIEEAAVLQCVIDELAGIRQALVRRNELLEQLMPPHLRCEPQPPYTPMAGTSL